MAEVFDIDGYMAADLDQRPLWPGEKLLPVEKRFKKGDTVWVIGDPPGRGMVVRDSGHPRWLKIRTSSDSHASPDPEWIVFRQMVRRSEKKAARAMVSEYRKEIAEREAKITKLRERFAIR